MDNYTVEIPENHYITEYPKQWMVQVKKDGEITTKCFNFKKCGGKEKALIKAKLIRDKLIKEKDIDLNIRFRKSVKEGVNRTFDNRKSGEKVFYWQATIMNNGKQMSKRFSEKTYGQKEAERLAVEWREKVKRNLEETGQTLFEKPSNNTNIWRYMDFTKFVYMLEKEALFFPKIDTFNDPYEGSYSKGNKAIRDFVFSRSVKKENFKELVNKIKKIRPFINVNCWHMNDFESDGMWKLYSQTNESICIKTQFKKLEKALPNNIKFSKVKYIDYKKTWIPETDIYYPFIYKRISFSHENELRAILDSSFGGLSDKFEETEFWIKVNLQILIQQIYVSPESPDWFLDLVEKVKNKYKLTNKRVYKSPLNNDPYE